MQDEIPSQLMEMYRDYKIYSADVKAIEKWEPTPEISGEFSWHPLSGGGLSHSLYLKVTDAMGVPFREIRFYLNLKCMFIRYKF